jgi:prolyl 4-hydroxylase
VRHRVPDHLESKTIKQQAIVPAFGLGFLKSRVPEPVRRAIAEHFDRSRPLSRPEPRYAHLQASEPDEVPSLLMEDNEFNRSILDTLRPLHEQWAGMALRGSACYGIRVYLKGSYLYEHVDRIGTHVISSTICVDHDLVAPWPLSIEDLDGNPHEVDMAPGDMIFYESARLKHGRPYPHPGEFYAALFVHYAPVHWPYTAADLG